jgi:hypothetical protein
MTLEEIEKLCNQATSGPWLVKESKAGYSIEPSITRAICYYVEEYPEASPEMGANDAKFIAASRTLMPILLNIARAALDENCSKCALEKAFKELGKI